MHPGFIPYFRLSISLQNDNIVLKVIVESDEN